MIHAECAVSLQVLARQKLWQKQWREKVEREGTLYDAIAVVDDIIIGRCESMLLCHTRNLEQKLYRPWQARVSAVNLCHEVLTSGATQQKVM